MRMMKVKMELIPLTGVRPLKLLILSNRADPPALIFASRRSRRRRAACCAGDSSVDMMLDFGLYGLSTMVEEKGVSQAYEIVD